MLRAVLRLALLVLCLVAAAADAAKKGPRQSAVSPLQLSVLEIKVWRGSVEGKRPAYSPGCVPLKRGRVSSCWCAASPRRLNVQFDFSMRSAKESASACNAGDSAPLAESL